MSPRNTSREVVKQVGFVVGIDVLQDGNDFFEAHACIHVRSRERFEMRGAETVVLHEDQIPEFDEAVAFEHFFIDRACAGAQVVVDLGTGSTGTSIGHFPEVVLAPHMKQVRGVVTGLRQPIFCGFFVGGDFAVFVLEDGSVETILVEPPDFGEQLPGPFDGFLFIVIAKRPVAEHLEEGVMGTIATNIFQVVVFAGHAHAFLRVDGARVGALVSADEHVFELHHARVGKQQRGIAARDKRSRWHGGMSMLDEEFDKGLADFRTGQFCRGHSISNE